VDPGTTRTPLTSVNKSARLLGLLLFRPLVMSARTVVNSCTGHEGTHGVLLIDYDPVPYARPDPTVLV
jgi:hypothetical protein